VGNSAFTRVFDALWAPRDFAHALTPSKAPLPTLRACESFDFFNFGISKINPEFK
jgi:hypothetical protein